MRALEKRKLMGAPRWMVTFADLMALLFALFVLLLSFAEVDSDSFRRNAGPMREAFGTGDMIMATTAMPSVQPGQSGPGQAQSQALAPSNPTAEIVQFDRRRKAKRSFLWQFRRSLERELSESRIVLIDEGDRIIIRFPGASNKSDDWNLLDHCIKQFISPSTYSNLHVNTLLLDKPAYFPK